MKVKVLGTGCANCKRTIALIDEVAKSKGLSIELEKVENIKDIMAYNILSTPGVGATSGNGSQRTLSRRHWP